MSAASVDVLQSTRDSRSVALCRRHDEKRARRIRFDVHETEVVKQSRHAAAGLERLDPPPSVRTCELSPDDVGRNAVGQDVKTIRCSHDIEALSDLR